MTYTPTAVPLCVDLDGTLVRTNTLIEAVLLVIRRRPLVLPRMLWWARRGQGHLWHRLAAIGVPDARSLPYAPEVVALVSAEAKRRPLVLVTGAHRTIAEGVAGHLGLFREVLASDGDEHLVGERKARALTDRFGQAGFDYVGDSSADLAVWRRARHAYLVSAATTLAEQVRSFGVGLEVLEGAPREPAWRAIVRAMRPAQWGKNALVLVPALLAHRVTEPAVLGAALIATLAFCITSSSVYILNDLLDVEADRRHPTKSKRPIASGSLSLRGAILLWAVLLGGAVAMLLALSPIAALLLIGYVVTTTAYTFWLKEKLAIDMVVLASFYVQRLFVGAAATGIHLSFWTLLFSLLVFMGLAAVKRYSEVHNREIDGIADSSRRAYVGGDKHVLQAIGTSCFTGALIAVGLYLGSDDVTRLYRRPELLWALAPVFLAWTSRLWLLSARGKLRDEDPVAFALRDRWTWAAAVIVGAIFVAAV